MRWRETYHLQVFHTMTMMPLVQSAILLPERLSSRYVEDTSGWTREYYGYVMFSHHRSTFECMDAAPETIPGGHVNQDGALFYHIEPHCGSLPCHPDVEQNEITCTVCSK